MTTMFYDKDADLALIRAKKVAVLGYGSQGHAHALNLKDSGVDVRVGLPAGSRSCHEGGRARPSPLLPMRRAGPTLIMILVPDTTQASCARPTSLPGLRSGKTLMFAHGFNIRFGWITPPADVDVIDDRAEGAGHARPRALSWKAAGTPRAAGRAPGRDGQGAGTRRCSCGKGDRRHARAGVIETTFAEETETDLFGEQVVLCGGVSALVKAGFETLTQAGYQPEVAYFECLHELKLIVDLMYRGGLELHAATPSATPPSGVTTPPARGSSPRRPGAR